MRLFITLKICTYAVNMHLACNPGSTDNIQIRKWRSKAANIVVCIKKINSPAGLQIENYLYFRLPAVGRGGNPN